MQQKLRCLIATLTLGSICLGAQAQVISTKDSSKNVHRTYTYQKPQARLLGKGKEVNWYALPQDRMTCVVPSKKSADHCNAWVKSDSLKLWRNMPNAAPVSQFIPDSSATVQ